MNVDQLPIPSPGRDLRYLVALGPISSTSTAMIGRRKPRCRSANTSSSCAARASTRWAERGAPHGIRVNAVMPGFVDSYPVGAATLAKIPGGRVGGVVELARTVAALASDDMSYVTGQCLLVDGGMLRGI